jgi:hypothetical protein
LYQDVLQHNRPRWSWPSFMTVCARTFQTRLSRNSTKFVDRGAEPPECPLNCQSARMLGQDGTGGKSSSMSVLDACLGSWSSPRGGPFMKFSKSSEGFAIWRSHMSGSSPPFGQTGRANAPVVYWTFSF